MLYEDQITEGAILYRLGAKETSAGDAGGPGVLILSTIGMLSLVNLCCGLSCTLRHVQQHPWPLPSGCL